ncbi:hypothetical protein LCGC14_3044250 [marine sediment metagenome]|uniref:Uncharacterized protein n=1 Tax=marine sediment metagenome TaxID=412755 RepID=A0A0F8ZEL2_9ZZZZ
MRVCDECLTAVHDETTISLTADEQANMARELGADIPDHRCDQFDTGDPCDCACYGGPTAKIKQTDDDLTDWEDDFAPTPCPTCGGETYLLGALGIINWRRCRACGMDSF